MAVSPFGFMLTDLTSSRYDTELVVPSSGSASWSPSSDSGSWATLGGNAEDHVDAVYELDHAGIAWWWLPLSVFALGVMFVLWATLSGALPCIPSSWGPWRLSEKRIWVDKCCECT